MKAPRFRWCQWRQLAESVSSANFHIAVTRQFSASAGVFRVRHRIAVTAPNVPKVSFHRRNWSFSAAKKAPKWPHEDDPVIVVEGAALIGVDRNTLSKAIRSQLLNLNNPGTAREDVLAAADVFVNDAETCCSLMVLAGALAILFISPGRILVRGDSFSARGNVGFWFFNPL